MKSFSNKIKFAGLALFATSTLALATVTFDAETGLGFVGKGDVQIALDLNNAGLQSAAGSLAFTYVSEVVTEVSWECTNENNDKVQERARKTTTEIDGVVTAIARVKSQITGFNLNGYTGTPTETSTSDGPALNSCPNSAGTWVLTTPAGDPEVISSTGGLRVNGVELPVTPPAEPV